jgi:outer membrane receptor protein involved in Fe transport
VGQVIELGNPRLKPEETTAYDVGLVQGLPLDFKLEVSAYYKDVQNLIQQAIYYDRGFIPYYTFTNLDYANIKGFHINLEKNAGTWSSIIRYNFQDATGKASTPFDNPIGYYEVALEGQGTVDLPDPEDVNLDYNRKHRLVWNLRFKSPKKFGPSLGSIYPLGTLSLSATYKAMSGRPYTWDPKGEGLRYNDTTPTETELNIRFQKRFFIGDYKTTFYVEGFNVLNEKHYSYYIYSNPQEIDQVKELGAASTEFLSVDDISPYLTSRTVRVISNNPRIFRFGVLFSF